MNLPLMRRGLSPEGCKIRERHQGTLTIGVQGITVHPTERSHSRRDFLQDNVKRLREIQARCKERDVNKRSLPLRATRDNSASTSSSLREAECRIPFKNGSAKLRRRSQSPEKLNRRSQSPERLNRRSQSPERFNRRSQSPERLNRRSQSPERLNRRSQSPERFNRRSQTPDREGSAHSDYFSLAEEQIEPLALSFSEDEGDKLDGIFTKSCEFKTADGLDAAAGNHSRSGSSLSQVHPISSNFSPVHSHQRQGAASPSRLKPMSQRSLHCEIATQAPPLRQDLYDTDTLHSNFALTHGLRRVRMDSLITKIKGQKPACEMDYNSHYRNIENQHRVLLDNSDALSHCSSGESGMQNGNDSQRSGKKVFSGNSKMTRSHSFDRDLLNKKSSSSKVSRLESTSDKKASKNVSKSPSPLIKRKLSKSISNLGCASSDLSKLPASKQYRNRTLEEKWRTESENEIKSSSNKFERSKCNLDGLETSSSVYDLQDVSHCDGKSASEAIIKGANMQYMSQFDEMSESHGSIRAASSMDANLNTTVLSTSDLNFPGKDQSYDERPEELQLNITSESQSDLGALHNHTMGDSSDEDFQYNEKEINKSYNDGELTEERCDYEGSHSVEPERTSTPVPNIQQNKNIPKLKQNKGGKTSQLPTLRRSQSLKNIKQEPWNAPLSYQRGKLPRYLLARKQEEQRLAEIAKSVDPDCPPGHAPLPECERRNTLHLLRKSQAEVMRDLSSLPVAQDTLRVKKKRHDLEEKLMQLEDGLRIFSQPKVYVVNDD